MSSASCLQRPLRSPHLRPAQPITWMPSSARSTKTSAPARCHDAASGLCQWPTFRPSFGASSGVRWRSVGPLWPSWYAAAVNLAWPSSISVRPPIQGDPVVHIRVLSCRLLQTSRPGRVHVTLEGVSLSEVSVIQLWRNLAKRTDLDACSSLINTVKAKIALLRTQAE